MEIEFMHCDITERPKKGIIAHGVNCQGAMGSGVAWYIRQKWPVVYKRFMESPKGAGMLGSTVLVNVQPHLYVANCYTQEYYGADGRRYADLDAVKKCLRTVFIHAQNMRCTLWLPKIASDRGGLSWEDEVFPVVQELAEEFNSVQCVVCTWP